MANHAPQGQPLTAVSQTLRDGAGLDVIHRTAWRTLTCGDGLRSTAGTRCTPAGDGQNYYTTDGGTIHLAPLSEGGTYYGWSLAPTSRPGV
jgi:hypothetical protein